MIDLETLALTPDAHILVIAARCFDPLTGPQREGLVLYPEGEQGRHVCPKTAAWWTEQSTEAREDAFRPTGRIPLPAALERLSAWLVSNSIERIWAKGPAFDAVILENAYRQAGQSVPWRFYQLRDVRTAVEMANVRLERTGTRHVALADVDHQIAQVCAAHQALRRAEAA